MAVRGGSGGQACIAAWLRNGSDGKPHVENLHTLLARAATTETRAG